MHPDAAKKISEMIDSGEMEVPRLFYIGHKCIATFPSPDKDAKWRCLDCNHEWVAYDGRVCPQCGSVEPKPK